ncbi:hypothetical protein Tco_0390548 [Tanacetum coccineum]
MPCRCSSEFQSRTTYELSTLKNVACVVKEGVKLYTYNNRSLHVEVARNKAIEASIADAISQGLEAQAAAKQAQKDGAKAAKEATRKAKRIIGPIISSGFGYLVGSELGSWAGGRIGLMVYDIVNGVHFLLTGQTEENVGKKVDFSQFDQTEETVGDRSEYGASLLKSVLGYVGSYISETSKDVNSEVVGEQNDIGGSFLESVMGYVGSYISEASKDVNSEVVDEADTYEPPVTSLQIMRASSLMKNFDEIELLNYMDVKLDLKIEALRWRLVGIVAFHMA